MPLKDLVAQKAALTEDAIEALISDFIRYDTDEKEIAFTPAAAALSNKAKVLTYLVALQGWPFVLDEAVPMSMKPGEMEERVGIPGGSLRPLLKDLKERHLIVAKDGAYSVRPSSLNAIRMELSESPAAPQKSRRSKRRASRAASQDAPPEDDHDGIILDAGEDDATDDTIVQSAVTTAESVEKKQRRATAKNGGAAAAFEKWLLSGFFKEARTLADVQRRFHKEAIIIPRTSIPRMLLLAVRNERLTRDKADVGGKSVWVYTQVQ